MRTSKTLSIVMGIPFLLIGFQNCGKDVAFSGPALSSAANFDDENSGASIDEPKSNDNIIVADDDKQPDHNYEEPQDNVGNDGIVLCQVQTANGESGYFGLLSPDGFQIKLYSQKPMTHNDSHGNDKNPSQDRAICMSADACTKSLAKIFAHAQAYEFMPCSKNPNAFVIPDSVISDIVAQNQSSFP